VNNIVIGLSAILESTPRRLAEIADTDAARKPAPGRWSKKEILGHLIDSAWNNHQRFLRAQFAERIEFPAYEQEAWVAGQAYGTASWPDLVNFWTLYNRHLLHVLRHVPERALAHEVSIGGNPPMTLAAVAEGYLKHANNHLAQILG
jgi:hypothetical protein